MGEAATSRGEGLEELRSRLASASTAKEVADLQARIQLESASMMNDQLRVDAMERARRAEQAAKTAEALSSYSRDRDEQLARARDDRKSVAEGQSVSVHVYLGCRGITKKKT